MSKPWKDLLSDRCKHQRLTPGKNERKREVSDYHYICNIDTPAADREKMFIGNIYINACECKKCGEYIRSCNRHDFVRCSCGAIMVDGGSWYCKRGGNLEDMIEDIVPFNEVERST